MVVGRPTPKRHDGFSLLKSDLADIRKQLKALKTGRRLESASIGGGGALSVLDVDGSTLLLVGQLSDGSRGLVAYRADGTAAFAIYGAGTNQFVAMYDRQGNIICSDDTASGQGLATPWLPLPFVPTVTPEPLGWSNVGDWVTVAQCRFYKQQPQVYVYAYCQTEASTSGAFRLWDGYNSVQIGDVLNLVQSSAVYFDFGGSHPITGAWQASSLLQLQVKVTSGTGRVGAQVTNASGIQS